MSNEEVHLHVELIKDTGDNYKHKQAAVLVTPVKRAVPPINKLPSPIPDSIDTMVNNITNSDCSSSMNIEAENTVNTLTKLVKTPTGTPKNKKMGSAEILDGSGRKYMTRSIKSAKRLRNDKVFGPEEDSDDDL